MNWYIGQPIVAIRSHSQQLVIKGQEFVILGIKKSKCKCFGADLDIGLKGNWRFCKCPRCGVVENYNGIGWVADLLFAPLDQDISELTEILETKQPFEL